MVSLILTEDLGFLARSGRHAAAARANFLKAVHTTKTFLKIFVEK